MLSVWSTSDWHQMGRGTKVSDFSIMNLSIRADGRLVAASSPFVGGHVALISLNEQGVPSEQVSSTVGDEPYYGVWSVAFSPAGDTLLAGDGDSNILVCRPGSDGLWSCKRVEGNKPGGPDRIQAIAYSPDGGQVAIGHSWRGIVEVRDAQVSSASRVLPYELPSPVQSLTFFDACHSRQLAIGTETGLAHRPVDPSAEDPNQVEACANAPWAQIGDQTGSVAFDRRSGLLAAATQAGYVALLDLTGELNPLRTRMQPIATSTPIRGALVTGAGTTAWLALPTEANASNVALVSPRDTRLEGHFMAGGRQITRLSASKRFPRLATIGCTPSKPSRCQPNDPYEVTVWQLTDTPDAPTRVASLASPDFKGRTPLRAILSPDGQWIVVAFRASRSLKTEQSPPEPLFALRLDGHSEPIWIVSNLRNVREIAFSEDGLTFAAGGAPIGSDNKTDKIRIWSVGQSGFALQGIQLTLTAAARIVQELIFVSDQKGRRLLFAGGYSGTINGWDLRTQDRQEVRVGSGALAISFIAYNRDQSLFAATDAQGVVHLWDATIWGQPNQLSLQLTPPIYDATQPGFLTFAERGALLAASADKVDFWDLDIGSLHRKACAMLQEVRPTGDVAWKADAECREDAQTPSPPSTLQRIRDSIKRAWASGTD